MVEQDGQEDSHQSRTGKKVNMSYWDKFRNDGIPFMEGREKGDIKALIGQPLHIEDFGFIRGRNGDFAVIKVRESERFYFCNSIITEMLRTVQADGMEKELAKQVIVFEERTSKTGQDYMTFKFE